MFLYWAVDVLSPIFGESFIYAHKALTCTLGAVFHGMFLALLLFLVFPILRFVPQLSRRTVVLMLAGVVAIDVVFLVFVVPMPPD